MGYARVKELVDQSYTGGQSWYSSYRKLTTLTSTQGSVVDLSMLPGNPRPNYYTGDNLVAKLFTSNYGIWSGGNVSPATKHLHKIMLLSASASVVPATFTLCDYLLFYPLIDMDSTDEQDFDNTVTLPRYTTGLGVQAFLVATNPYIGGGQFYITYVNSDGVTMQSRIMTCNTNANIATVVHSGVQTAMHGNFINLAGFCRGIQSVSSIQFLSSNGGLATLVLCMPLANVYVREATTPAEWDFLLNKNALPKIYDGAYLNFLAAVNGNIATVPIIGDLQFIWN